MSPRAVLDTNVLVSGLISDHSPPRQLVDAWLDGRYTLVTSLYQVQELNHVLSYPRIASRLDLEEAELEMILAALLSQAEVVAGELQLPGVTRDPKDDAIVACAQEGGAGYIVSGDRDLLDLGEYKGIRVVTPREFVEMLAPEPGQDQDVAG
jgi:putative PIN family toxin of toxin-antitoxin system